MNKANSGGKGFHPATICIFWKKGNQWQNKTYKQYSQQVNSAIYIYFNALLPGILCIPRIHITCWNHTAHLSWAAVPPRGKVCMKYSDMRNPICRIPRRNGKMQAAKSFSRKDCLPYFADQNGCPHLKEGRAVLYLKSSSSSTSKAASGPLLGFQLSYVPDI